MRDQQFGRNGKYWTEKRDNRSAEELIREVAREVKNGVRKEEG